MNKLKWRLQCVTFKTKLQTGPVASPLHALSLFGGDHLLWESKQLRHEEMQGAPWTGPLQGTEARVTNQH